MNFQFNSLADFWAMSGHGPYVWAAYAITLVGFTLLILQARQRRSSVVKKIKLAARLAERAEESTNQ